MVDAVTRMDAERLQGDTGEVEQRMPRRDHYVAAYVSSALDDADYAVHACGQIRPRDLVGLYLPETVSPRMLVFHPERRIPTISFLTAPYLIRSSLKRRLQNYGISRARCRGATNPHERSSRCI